MIYIVGKDQAHTDLFAERIIKGTYDVYGYPDIKNRLSDGHTAITSVEDVEAIEEPISMKDVLYVPDAYQLIPRATLGDIIDALTIKE